MIRIGEGGGRFLLTAPAGRWARRVLILCGAPAQQLASHLWERTLRPGLPLTPGPFTP